MHNKKVFTFSEYDLVYGRDDVFNLAERAIREHLTEQMYKEIHEEKRKCVREWLNEVEPKATTEVQKQYITHLRRILQL